MATTAQVLKPNCSLVGKSLIPAIIKVKAVDDGEQTLPELSRFQKDQPLESYSKPALIKEMEKLTGKQLLLFFLLFDCISLITCLNMSI